MKKLPTLEFLNGLQVDREELYGNEEHEDYNDDMINEEMFK